MINAKWVKTLTLVAMIGAAVFGFSGHGQAAAAYNPTIGNKVIEAGKKYLGVPYVWGSSRATKTSMDCSEFVMWAYRDGAGINMGTGGANSQADYIKKHGTYTTNIKNLKKGDIVFFSAYRGTSASSYKGLTASQKKITHVGIYMGNNKLIQTYSKESGGVKITSFEGTHWGYRFVGGGRPY
ncbi:C40 family peptidase [Gorillibacterium massiliense]|uniref:C40 family peptidase n=1 Tax=Gorillibacterium massiliense TaxID=1280390 RepID=UPI0004AD0492|nr:NlpC/P60 family protein [Gorillibacterium massiliense]